MGPPTPADSRAYALGHARWGLGSARTHTQGHWQPAAAGQAGQRASESGRPDRWPAPGFKFKFHLELEGPGLLVGRDGPVTFKLPPAVAAALQTRPALSRVTQWQWRCQCAGARALASTRLGVH